ncbi:MAG: DUF188 domain-containing protein [Defluviitaleaceae bacterium]|nr:DUF188 domain-containing protein [Defluviitaleaceae bacterium]
MKIYIDGDGCPVVDITVRLANTFGVDCIIICDTSHVFDSKKAKVITVSKGKDSVDFALLNMVAAGDIVITGDYGLAAMCLAKKSIPIHHNGMVYSDDNIQALLMQRHNNAAIRRAGGRLEKIKKRDPSQNSSFEKTLRSLLASSLRTT